jgi:hypothetical protein
MTLSTPFTPCTSLGASLLASLLVFSITGCDNGASDANGGTDPLTVTGTGGDGSMTSGGTGGTGASMAPMDVSMIDDMEDKDGSILAAEGRVGAWYTYNDTTGTQVPPAGQMGFDMTELTPPRDTSTYAANTSGSGFTTWGAGIGFDLNNDGSAKQPYDASAYKGVTFWAKAGTGGIKNIRMNVQDAQTAPEGGICDKTATKGCNDHRGTAVLLTEEWKQFTFAFDAMKVVGFGQTFPTFQTNKLFAIQFQASQNVKFDIWLDDVAFYK